MKGWLLDAYVVPGAIRLWWILEDGRRVRTQRTFSPTFYVGLGVKSEYALRGMQVKAWDWVKDWLAKRGGPVVVSETQKQELHSGQLRPVLAVQVVDPNQYARVVRELTAAAPWLVLYQADLPVVQYAFDVWDWYPTVWCELEIDLQGNIITAQRLDSRRDIDPVVPVLRFLSVELEAGQVNPRHGQPGRLIVKTWESSVPQRISEQRELVLESGEDGWLDTLCSLMQSHDPDVVISAWGDDFLLPHVLQQAQKSGVQVPWNRDQQKQVHTGLEHTYFSYGQVRHRAPIITFFGRLHIDTRNSFLYSEGEVDGLFELARLSGLPVQRLARTTIGTAMSAMQLLTAMCRGVLIPVEKRQPEDWKTAAQLIQSDKGGLVYQPTLGFHEDVVELDFASLYPAIMVRRNVSPETVNCACCPQAPTVPEIGYRICQKRYGLVSETLEIILDKRAEFKRRMKIELDPVRRAGFDRRQNILKWILVTCFGYLGFKNARFGRIEAHESVTAFGRELLLRAKDAAEQAGFRFLHGIVDSVWLWKPGVTAHEAEVLSQSIFQLTGIEMKIEGIYKWIAFLPSKEDPLMPVANRYFGLFDSGEYKVRGIELRRHDTPELVLRFQRAVLAVIHNCQNVEEIMDAMPKALEVLREYVDEVARGTVPFADLALTRRLSRDPKSYQNRTLTAVVAQELMGRGVELSPGEMIQYVMTDTSSGVVETRARALAHIDADWSYDTKAYQELLLRAFDSLFAQLGYDLDWLNTHWLFL